MIFEMNILNDRISQEYNIVSSELERADGRVYILVGLSDDYSTKIEIHPNDTHLAYRMIERELGDYYFLKNRKEKLKKIRK